MDHSEPYFSIIICTKGGRLLTECFDAIIFDLLRSRESYEIIIVAHRSESLLIDKITQEYASKSINIKYSVQDRDGLPNARNCGLKIAIGKTIVFLDDDVIIEQGYFSEVEKVLLREVKVGGVTGVFKGTSFVPPKFFRLKAIFDKMLIGSWTGEGGAIGKVFYNGMSTCNFEFAKDVTEVDILSGSNMAYTRRVISDCGFFDENFKGAFAAFEDADYSYRVKNYGYKLLVNPNMKLAHLNIETKPFFSENRIYYTAFNGVYFFFKNVYHYKLYQLVSFFKAHIYTFVLFLVGGLWNKNAHAGLKYLQGLFDGFRCLRFRLSSCTH